MKAYNKINSETIARFIGLIVILVVFILLIFHYYKPEIFKTKKENPRFVDVDYNALKKQADRLKIVRSNTDAKEIFVLTYHRITKDEPSREFEQSYDQFKNNMFALKQNGYQTIKTDDLYQFMRGEKVLPDKSFLLTFDDGAKQSFYNGDPILKALNYTAVMFVIADHAINNNNSAYYLNESELQSLKNTGRWEIESHTYQSHFRFPIDTAGNTGPALTNKLWILNENRLETDREYFNRVSNDLQTSKNILESEFNIDVKSFALPYGDFGERNSNYNQTNEILYNLTTSIYQLVFYEFPLRDNAYRGNYIDKTMDSYLISRLPADALDTPDKLLQRIDASRVIELSYKENYSNPDRWIRIIGEASFNKDSIILSNSKSDSTESILSYLDGSYLWKDYYYTVEIKNTSASRVILISRFVDPYDYVACSYTNNSVSILEYSKNTPTKRIKQSAISKRFLFPGATLSMSVYGSTARCYINGQEIITGEVSKSLSHGGVGIKAENFDSKDKSLEFRNIYVTGIY